MSAQRMEQVVRAYIEACNEGDATKIAACFCPDGAHYFPIGNPPRPRWLGADTIGNNFAKMVADLGVSWTVDRIIIDPQKHGGGLEWTRFTPERDRILRGVDWFSFDPETFLIREVKTYRASPMHPDMECQELQDFDYAGRGYPMLR
jgi:hypothetical protein